MDSNTLLPVPLSIEDPEIARIREAPIVLIVDDERLIADTLAIILTRSGFKVMTAYDGRSALGLAKRTKPSILISDVVMPEMSGIDLALLLRNIYPSCKVLLFSGQAATLDLLQNARERGHSFPTLIKPVHPKEILERVYDLLGYRDGEACASSLVSQETA